MSCMNPIANYNTATQVDQPSIEKGESRKSLDDSKSTWQMGNSNCETDHIPFKKANGEFLNRPKQKDNPEIGTAMKPGEYLKPQDILNRVETVIAKYAFLPQHEDDLGFKKGDSIIVLEKREDGWWRGRVEQKEGWFPSNCILVENESAKPASKSEPASALVNQSSQKEITCERQIPPFLSEKWFWGDITRVDAEKLIKETAADGDFLVRESKSEEGAYAISVKAVGKIKHFKVTLEDGKVKGGASINFNSLQEFIQHFKRFPIFTDKDGNKMFLVKPFEKSA